MNCGRYPPTVYYMYLCMNDHRISQRMDQPVKVCQSCSWSAQKKRKIPDSVCAREFGLSRDWFGRPVPRHPAPLHIQAESGAYSRDSSRFPRQRHSPFMILSLFHAWSNMQCKYGIRYGRGGVCETAAAGAITRSVEGGTGEVDYRLCIILGTRHI